MNDRGEIGFRLGDFEAEDNYRSYEVGIAEKEQTVASSADKGKAVAKPNAEPTSEPKSIKKDPKGKLQLPLNNFH
ncbi:hypothetical protein Tco_0480242 [Tanacetum coccineum]